MTITATDVAKSLYASMRRADSDSLLDLFAADAILYGPTTKDLLPWGGVFQGRERVRLFFGLIDRGLEIEQLDIIDFIAEDEKVAVIGYVAGRIKQTGSKFGSEFVHIFRVDKSAQKIVELKIFNDSASLVEAADTSDSQKH